MGKVSETLVAVATTSGLIIMPMVELITDFKVSKTVIKVAKKVGKTVTIIAKPLLKAKKLAPQTLPMEIGLLALGHTELGIDLFSGVKRIVKATADPSLLKGPELLSTKRGAAIGGVLGITVLVALSGVGLAILSQAALAETVVITTAFITGFGLEVLLAA